MQWKCGHWFIFGYLVLPASFENMTLRNINGTNTDIHWDDACNI